MSEYKILVVDDEPDLREILQCNFENAGYHVDTAASAEEALELLTDQHDLLLLDVMLGGMSGYQLASVLRKERNNNIPIIFLTAKDTEVDMLTGFSAGGDDYISKPFSLQEVLARIKAVLRRSAPKAAGVPSQISLGAVLVDVEKKRVVVDGAELRLSKKEFGILKMLMTHPGRLFSREEILTEVRQGESCVLDRTVDVHIARIRRKLGKESTRLTNRQGYGYCFE